MSEIKHVTGSQNVFADIGLSNPDLRRQKANLAIRIIRKIEAQGLTQIEASKILGIDQPKISAIKRGRLKDFSIQRLMVYLSRLGDPHEIRPALNWPVFSSAQRALSMVPKGQGPALRLPLILGSGALIQSFSRASETFRTFPGSDALMVAFLDVSANVATRSYDQEIIPRSSSIFSIVQEMAVAVPATSAEQRPIHQMSFQQQIGR